VLADGWVWLDAYVNMALKLRHVLIMSSQELNRQSCKRKNKVVPVICGAVEVYEYSSTTS